MKIPKSFSLYGQTIRVKYDNTMNNCGLTNYNKNTIALSKKHCQTRTLLEQTFCHELLHHILLQSKVVNKYKLENGKELHSDEDFIDNVSALLHQALTTMK